MKQNATTNKTAYQEATAKDNVIATLYENGELQITGTGDTAPFNLKSNAPWYEDYRNAVTKITFEQGVAPTSLSFFAYGLEALETSPEIPKCVLSLDNMFRGCVNLKTAPEIPKGVTNMRGAFNSCKELMQAPQIPNSVKNMDSTFYGCTRLTEAPAIPSSVTYLRGLFTGCRALETAPQIPESVTDLQSAFRNCKALKGKLQINAATDGGQLVLYFNVNSETTVDNLLTTKSENSNIVKYITKKPLETWNIGGNGVVPYNSLAKDNVKAILYDDGELRITGNGNTAVFSSANTP